MVDPTGAIVGGVLGALGSGGSSTQTTTPSFTPEVQPFVTPAVSQVAGAAPREVFTDPRVAGFDPMQTQGLDMASALSSQAGATQGNINQAFNQFATGGYVGSNPFLDAQIQAAQGDVQRNLERNILPSVRNTAVVGGGVGGSRQGIAEGLAMSDANQQSADLATAMRSGAYTTDMANMLQALQGQGNILSGQTAPMDILMGAGGVEQQQQQNVIGGEMATFNEQQDLQYQRDLEFMQSMLGSPTGTTTTTPGANPLVSAAGGALVGQQLYTPQPTTPTPYTPSQNPYLPMSMPPGP